MMCRYMEENPAGVSPPEQQHYMLLGTPTFVLSAGLSLRLPLDKGFEQDACTVCKSCYEFTFFRRLFPPVFWETIQGPEMRIISKTCLSLALLLLTSYSPLLARTF